MKSIIFTYCEGNDTKIAVVTKDKDKVKVLKADTFEVVQPAIDMEDSITGLKIEGEDLSFVDQTGSTSATERQTALSSVNLMSDSLKEFNLKQSLFVPALSEPAIYYHLFEVSKIAKSSKITQEIIEDIQESKNVSIDKENLGYVELSDKSLLAVFLSGEVPCIKLINSLARYNGKRYYKIPSVKSAEISLAYYIAKRKKFFPDDQSLIVYIGKEYSKLIFLQGRKLKHIGSTLDIGTLNLHTYDVYFSKILLEMENGGITSLDNIIVCGEDDSENLILSFYGTFPEANVSRLEFDDLDLSSLKQETKERFSAYSIPAAVAIDYLDDLDEIHKGINLLPRYVKEEQKIFQFAWHGFAMLPLLFLATFYITQNILSNNSQIKKLDAKVAEQNLLVRENQSTLNKINNLQTNINGFARTQAILDSASVGAGVWSTSLKNLSEFFSHNKDIWLTNLSNSGTTLTLNGYALNRNVLTSLAFSIKSAELKSVNFEALREKDAYKFNLFFNIINYQKSLN